MLLKEQLIILGRGTARLFHRRTVIALPVCLAVALAGQPPPAGHAAGSSVRSLAAQIDSYLTGLTAQRKFSGSVLVARKGTVVLSKGYGLADREHKLSNTPSTRYPVSGVSFSFSILGALWLEEHGKLADQASICTYLAHCPAFWRPITLHMVLDGTSGLPSIDWGNPGMRTSDTLTSLQALPLDGKPGSKVDYQNGDVVVLASIIEKVSGEPWAAFLRRTIFAPAGMARSGRLTDDLATRIAQGYTADGPAGAAVYNDYFLAYGTAPDVYAYDNALFGGRLVSRAMLARLLGAGAATSGLHNAYTWQQGRVAGHRAVYTNNGGNGFTTINARFVQDGVTIAVISNDDTNKVPGIAVQLAATVFS